MRRSRLRGVRDGQSVVEFALAFVVFIMVMFAAIQLGYAVYSYNMVCAAAREGVRYAIVHYSADAAPEVQASIKSEIQQAAIAAAPGLRLQPADVQATWVPDPELPSATDARVIVNHVYKVDIPFMAPFNVTLTSTSQMLVSQ
jgi:Flp pilus assembly protein TadG